MIDLQPVICRAVMRSMSFAGEAASFPRPLAAAPTMFSFSDVG